MITPEDMKRFTDAENEIRAELNLMRTSVMVKDYAGVKSSFENLLYNVSKIYRESMDCIKKDNERS
jgi:hypothetical protein